MQRIEHNVSTGETQIVELTPEEEQAILDAQPTPAQILQSQIADLKAQLEAMERQAIMPRGAREKEVLTAPLLALLLSTLTPPQQAAMAVIEAQLYAGNPFYKGVKDTNIAATAIRAQIRALT